MKKNYLILIGLIAIITLVIAGNFNVGQIYNQQQLDSIINVSNLDLGHGFVRDANNKVMYSCEWVGKAKICSVNINITIVYPIIDDSGEYNDKYIGEYNSTYSTPEIKFRAKKYIDLKNNYNITYARNQLKKFLIENRDQIYADNIRNIESFQTPPGEDIDDIMSGINL